MAFRSTIPASCSVDAAAPLHRRCIARAAPDGEAIDVTAHGGQPGTGELEDARWFSREEARQMLRSSAAPPGGGEGGLRTPPPLAIAHHMIRRWAEEDPRWPSLT